MSPDELETLVEETRIEDLLNLIGALESAKTAAILRLTASTAEPVAAPELHDGEATMCLGVERVAELLGLRPSAVYELLRTKRLPGYKEGKYWQIPRAALEDHVRRRLEETQGRTYRAGLPKAGALRATGRG